MFLLLGHASNRGVFNPRLEYRLHRGQFAPISVEFLTNGVAYIVFCKPISYYSGVINKSRLNCGSVYVRRGYGSNDD